MKELILFLSLTAANLLTFTLLLKSENYLSQRLDRQGDALASLGSEINQVLIDLEEHNAEQSRSQGHLNQLFSERDKQQVKNLQLVEKELRDIRSQLRELEETTWKINK